MAKSPNRKGTSSMERSNIHFVVSFLFSYALFCPISEILILLFVDDSADGLILSGRYVCKKEWQEEFNDNVLHGYGYVYIINRVPRLRGY